MTIDLSKINVRLKRDHPMLKGLAGYYRWNRLIDLSGNSNDIFSINTSLVPKGLQTDANGEFGALNNTGEILVNADTGTIITYVQSYSAFSDSAIRVIFGRNGPTAAAGDFAIAKNNDNNFYIIMAAGETPSYALYNASHFSNWQTGQQLAILWDRNNSPYIALFIDGKFQNPNSSAGLPWSDFTVNSNLAVLNDILDTTRYFNGVCSFMYIYNRVLSEEEIRSIYLDPDLLIDPVFSSTFFFSAHRRIFLIT